MTTLMTNDHTYDNEGDLACRRGRGGAPRPGPPAGRPPGVSLLLQLALFAGVRFAVNLPGVDALRKQRPGKLRKTL